ncbi:porin [Comamonas sp. w2-DMI]|uniref:porin n=1 Tax=Comamonas sp. w2-DMI TaxID=3126391 RepID=UPI0032E45FAC
MRTSPPIRTSSTYRKYRLFLAMLLFSFSAMAQNSQTRIYGIMDMYVGYGKSGSKSITKLNEGGNAGSRIGFQGVEDLGGGLKARFDLEAGIGADTGSGEAPDGSLAFLRQSSIGLTSRWGLVDFGRMYTPMFIGIVQADPYVLNATFSPLNLRSIVDSQQGVRAFASRGSNMIRYMTPPEQNFFAILAYSFGEQGSSSQRLNDLYGGSLGWKDRSFYLAYSFQNVRTASTDQPLATPITSRYQALSAYYRIRPELMLSANIAQSGSNHSATRESTLRSGGISWQASVQSRLMAVVAHRRVEASARGQTVWTLGYDYALSKRTELYGRLLGVNNRGGAAVALGGVPIEAAGSSSGRFIAAGIRHSF